MSQTNLILAVCMIAIFSACSNFNATDLRPYYLELSEPSIATIPLQGAPTHKIRDAWIFTQDQELGPFEVPVTLPVLEEGSSSDIVIFPGIRQNGRESVPIINPYIQPIQVSVDASPGETYPIDLEFQYYDDVAFPFVEDFSGSHTFVLENDEYEGSNLTVVEDPLDPTNKVARLNVDQDNPVCEVFTSSLFLPSDFNGNGYLEINYSSDSPLTLGVMKTIGSYQIPEYIIILNPRPLGNKLYLDLADIIADNDIGQFSLLLNLSLAGTSILTAEAFVDNIKLIHL